MKIKFISNDSKLLDKLKDLENKDKNNNINS